MFLVYSDCPTGGKHRYPLLALPFLGSFLHCTLYVTPFLTNRFLMRRLYQYLITLSIISIASYAICLPLRTHQFYHAPLWHQEPRICTPHFSTIELFMSHTRATKSFDSTGHKSALFDLYGTHNIATLGDGILLDSTNPLDLLLENFKNLGSDSCINNVSIGGTFKLNELIAHGIHTTSNGLFVSATIGIAAYQIKKPTLKNIPSATFTLNQQDIVQQFFDSFDALLTRYGLPTAPHISRGLGDTLLGIGYSTCFFDDPVADFIDIAGALQIVIPTSRTQNLNDLPLRPFENQGHAAFIASLAVAAGFLEWITFGLALDSFFFLPHTTDIHIKTDIRQSGIIRLACAHVTSHKRPQLMISYFAKADHVSHGLSLLGGYQFVHQGSMRISLPGQLEASTIASNDQRLASWQQHAFFGTIEYDFAKWCSSNSLRMALTTSINFSGLHSFASRLISGSLAFDIKWRF